MLGMIWVIEENGDFCRGSMLKAPLADILAVDQNICNRNCRRRHKLCTSCSSAGLHHTEGVAQSRSLTEFERYGGLPTLTLRSLQLPHPLRDSLCA